MAIINVKEGNASFSSKKGPNIIKEAAMFRSFDHPTIPTVIKVKEDVILLSLIVGNPLEAWVAKFPGLTDAVKNSICSSLLSGLRNIHEVFVVHGNINMQTIYVHERSMKPMFVNFESSFMNGEATAVADNGFFTSPETRRGTMTCKSDVFSLGMVFSSLTIGKLPLDWGVDYCAFIDMATAAASPWMKVMLHVDPRVRGMADTVLQFMGDVPAPCRNPFHAALHSALSSNEARRLQGWKDLILVDNAVGFDQPWDIAMRPMLIFVSTVFDAPVAGDKEIIGKVIAVLQQASVAVGGLSLVEHRIRCADLELFFLACIDADKDATLSFINACAFANLIELSEGVLSAMLQATDNDDKVMALIGHTKISPGAALIIGCMHAGAKRKADEALRANKSAAEANETIAAIASMHAIARLLK